MDKTIRLFYGYKVGFVSIKPSSNSISADAITSGIS